MEREPLEFWFEFASTYSYPAAMRIEELATEAKISIRWRPFLLGPIFAAQGWADSPFNLYPVKGRYMWRDMARLCQKYELPFRRPGEFPRSGLLAARVALWAAREPWCPSFVRAIYRANFAEDRDIARTEFVAEILASMGLRPDDIIARAQSSQNKLLLREQTDRAITLGIFGAPTLLVGEELFWGNDRLEDAFDFYLNGGYPG